MALVEQHRVTNRASALLSNFGVVLVVELGFRGKAPPPRPHEILPDASDLPLRQAGDLHDVGVGALNVEMIVVGQQRNPCPPRQGGSPRLATAHRFQFGRVSELRRPSSVALIDGLATDPTNPDTALTVTPPAF